MHSHFRLDARVAVGLHSALLLLGIFTICAGPRAAFAARGIINANQHPVDSGAGCGQPPAFPTLGQSAWVSSQAYHVGGNQAEFDQARCYNHYERPRIFSDDASFAGWTRNSRQHDYILALCGSINEASPDTARGVEHYEHWEKSLSDGAKRGDTYAGFSTWPQFAKDMATWYATNVRDSNPRCSTELAPNGQLARDTVNPRRLLWNGSGATLIGFGHMGALSMGDRTVLVGQESGDGYLGSIRKYGANLTRIWSLEQWSGRAVCPSPSMEGLTPFSGTWPQYDLSIGGLNPKFFSRLREFAQLSADRGIVVQLSVYDKHGLVNRDCPFAWAGSPYNMEANTTYNPRFIDGTALNNACDCTLCDAPTMGESAENPPTCDTIDAVLNSSNITPIHAAYLKRVAQEVGGAGNMIFEIMNEMYAGYDWASIGETWQMNSVAQKLNLELPVSVSRDAFNVESCGSALAGKSPDRGPGPWANAVNSKIVCTKDSETQIQMGRVRALDSPTYSVMQGVLPLVVVSSRSALGARATASNLLPQLAMMKIGFARKISPLTADNVFVEATRLDLESPLTHFALAIKKTVNNTVTTVASVPYFTASDAVNLHLVVDLHGTATATLYADSTPLLENVALNLTSTFMNNLAFAYFRGEKTSTKYAFRPTDGEVDDFEADIYCSDTNPPFNCVP